MNPGLHGSHYCARRSLGTEGELAAGPPQHPVGLRGAPLLPPGWDLPNPANVLTDNAVHKCVPR